MWTRERKTGMEALIATDPPAFSHLKTSHHLVCFWFCEINQGEYIGVYKFSTYQEIPETSLEISSTGFHTGRRLSRFLNPLHPHPCRIRSLNGKRYEERRSKHSGLKSVGKFLQCGTLHCKTQTTLSFCNIILLKCAVCKNWPPVLFGINIPNTWGCRISSE